MSNFYISFSYIKFGLLLRIGAAKIQFTNIEDITTIEHIDHAADAIRKMGYTNPKIINYKKIA